MYAHQLQAYFQAGLVLCGYEPEEREYVFTGTDAQWNHAYYLEDKLSGADFDDSHYPSGE